MSDESRAEARSFYDLAPGDTVTRMLAGVVPMTMTVTRVDEKLIYASGGWMFERATGFEYDPPLRYGSEYGATGSFLVRD